MLPPLSDALEIIFMGPGLVCLLVVILGGGMSLFKRVSAHRAAAIERLTDEATKLFSTGRLEEARVKAESAVALAPRRPMSAARAHYALGRVLARTGELQDAEVQLAKAVSLDTDPHLTALATANLALVLQRQGRAGEALERAGEAERIHGEMKNYPQPIMRAGAGWAHVAMSLALTDTGRDGEESANQAIAVFDAVEVADGLAHAFYAKAYALRARHDQRAYGPASEAFHRFNQLHEAIPALYADRLRASRKLLDEVSGQTPRDS